MQLNKTSELLFDLPADWMYLLLGGLANWQIFWEQQAEINMHCLEDLFACCFQISRSQIHFMLQGPGGGW